MKTKIKSKDSLELAIVSFVLGIFALIPFLGIIPAILSLVFGYDSFSKIKKNKSLKGKGFAKAGITMGIIGIGYIAILILIFFMAFMVSFVGSGRTLNEIEKSVVYVKYDFKIIEDGKISEYSFSGSGIVYSNESKKLKILTNRHVVDCGYTFEKCDKRISEEIFVNVGNKLKKISEISFAPNNLDAALLVLNSDEEIPSVKISEDTEIGETVFAIGYPLFAEGVVEFLKTKGKITGFRRLFLENGFPFEGISSNVYTTFGNSGGGLFNKNGDLIGINTWVSETESYAIKMDQIKDMEKYEGCEEGYLLDEKCVGYCYRGSSDCIRECIGTHCMSENFEGFCGSENLFCSTSQICFEDKCKTCFGNKKLYQDGVCRE